MPLALAALDTTLCNTYQSLVNHFTITVPDRRIAYLIEPSAEAPEGVDVSLPARYDLAIPTVPALIRARRALMCGF